jgi:transposase
MHEVRHEGERYRRTELVTGARRRRTWSADEKARIVAESAAAGANISEVARRNGVSRGSLTVWRRQARAVAEGAAQLRDVATIVEVCIENSGRPRAEHHLGEAASEQAVSAVSTSETIEIALADTTGRVREKVDFAPIEPGRFGAKKRVTSMHDVRHEGKAAAYRRVEAITGARRRKSWSAGEKAQIVGRRHGDHIYQIVRRPLERRANKQNRSDHENSDSP